jgi:hypothetical protein
MRTPSMFISLLMAQLSQGRQAHSHTPAGAIATDADANTIADAKLREAQQAAMAEDWRACADGYLEAYLRSDSTWPLRYNCLSGYASVLREGHFTPSDYDRLILRQIMDSEASPKHHTVQVLSTHP